MAEIDQLAVKRDSSPAPPTLRSQLVSLRKRSIIRRVIEWYNDLSWPYDWDETVLGLRYSVTALLLIGAFFALISAFVN